MKISGIVCEYNPFHNGHYYHIQETKKNGATHIVAVMSGNFVQRGDAAVIDKHQRATLAVQSGVDLVIEIPVSYCLAPAEIYARGAVYLMNALGIIDEISFGSECGDINTLIKSQKLISDFTSQNSYEILNLVKSGLTYPKSVDIAISKHYPEISNIISKPNNTLALEYINALSQYAPNINAFTIKRKNVEHDSDLSKENFASASYIRQHLFENFDNIKDFMPNLWTKAIKSNIINRSACNIKNLEKVILYKLRTSSLKDLTNVYDIGSGMAERIYSARLSPTLEDLFANIKSKNFTMARIRRTILNILIGIYNEDMINLPPYIRILASNNKGLEILPLIKKNALIPYGTSLAKLSKNNDVSARFVSLEAMASDIYALCSDCVKLSPNDYTHKFSIVK